MHARALALISGIATLTAVALISACAAEPTEERSTPDATAITVPECTPAAKDSQGECAANDDSDALLQEYISQCPFGIDVLSEDWTEDFGWIWWNPADPGSTAALGVEIASGNALCT